MNPTRIFLDTNVLVYAHDASSQYHTVSANLLTAVLAEQFEAVLAEQNLVELYRVLTNSVAMRNNPLSATQARGLIENTYLGGQFQIVYPNRTTLRRVLELASQRNITSSRVFDLRIAALAVSAQVDYLVTFNVQDFTGIDGLTALLPQQVTI